MDLETRGSCVQGYHERIRRLCAEGACDAAAVKREYGVGGSTWILEDGTVAFVDTYRSKGLRIVAGDRALTITWVDVAHMSNELFSDQHLTLF